MAEKQHKYAQVNVPPFNEYVEMQQDAIDLLKVRYARKNITLTDLEAWQYLTWCQHGVMVTMDSLGGDEYVQVGYSVRNQIAVWAAAHYTQQATGVLQPPVGPRFDTPEALGGADVPKADVSPETSHGHRGYL